MVELSLAEYREQLAIQRLAGAELERERIIELLEDHGQYMNNREVHAANRLIALIKGKPDAEEA